MKIKSIAEIDNFGIFKNFDWDSNLKYQNKRPDYTEAFWNVINWEAVSKKYDSIVK